MYIITEKRTRTIIAIGNELAYQKNGYLSLTDKRMTFPKVQVNVYEVDELPEGVEVAAYCYTPGAGFYENPHFGENENMSADKWAAEVMQEVSGYGY